MGYEGLVTGYSMEYKCLSLFWEGELQIVKGHCKKKVLTKASKRRKGIRCKNDGEKGRLLNLLQSKKTFILKIFLHWYRF